MFFMRSHKRQVPDMMRVHHNFFLLLPKNLQIEAEEWEKILLLKSQFSHFF